MYSPFAHLSFWYSALGAPPDRAPPRIPSPRRDPTRRTRAAWRCSSGDSRRAAASAPARPRREGLPPSLVRAPPDLAGRGRGLLRPPMAALGPGGDARGSARETAGGPSQARPRRSSRATRRARWVAWFTAHVKQTLAYPDPTPWERSAGTGGGAGLPLAARRARADAAARGPRHARVRLRRPPPAPREAQQWLWGLPAHCQPVAQETVEKSSGPTIRSGPRSSRVCPTSFPT